MAKLGRTSPLTLPAPLPGERGAGGGDLAGAYKRSMTVAMPCPKPMHIVCSP
jgi:hypothetical protein